MGYNNKLDMEKGMRKENTVKEYQDFSWLYKG
jgi:hypothetical protein